MIRRRSELPRVVDLTRALTVVLGGPAKEVKERYGIDDDTSGAAPVGG